MGWLVGQGGDGENAMGMGESNAKGIPKFVVVIRYGTQTMHKGRNLEFSSEENLGFVSTSSLCHVTAVPGEGMEGVNATLDY
jgi:hypothetical protein